MADTQPPELPRLPPVRESAEQALPPAPDEPYADPPKPKDESAREKRRRGRREQPPQEAEPRARRRDDRIPRSEDGRRLSTAGHGLVVAVLGLTFGALLLAPGMHKASFNGQPGTKRDVSLALTGGLAHVSHALLLDRPRGLVQDAMGRGDADRIDVAVVVPATTVTPGPRPKPTKQPTTSKPEPPAKIAFTPKKKLRLWVAGDSLVITPGYAIVRAAGGSPVIQSVGSVDGHVATGLTRPDVFNWFQELTAQMKSLKPKVVVLNFGANDDHNYMTGLPDGTSIGAFMSPTWVAEYRRRVAGVMNIVNRAGGVVVWIGLPITRSETQTQEFDQINAIVLDEAKSRPGKAIFIDTYTMFAGANGGFAEYLQNGRGDTVKVRAGDGVHFDTAGGDMIAREVLKRLNELFDLTSWRTRTASS